MQKGFKSQKPKSNQPFILDELLKGLDDDQIFDPKPRDPFGNYQTVQPKRMDPSEFVKKDAMDFKEFDFLMKKPKPKSEISAAKKQAPKKEVAVESTGTSMKNNLAKTIDRMSNNDDNLFAQVKGNEDLFGALVRKQSQDPSRKVIDKSSKSPMRSKQANDDTIQKIFGTEPRTFQPKDDRGSSKTKKTTLDNWRDILYNDDEMPDLIALLTQPRRESIDNQQERGRNIPEENYDEDDAKHGMPLQAPTSKRGVHQSVYERNKEFLERKKERLKQIEKETAASFKPKINKKSALIDRLRMGNGGYPRYESLHGLDEVLKQREQQLKELIEQERFEKFEKQELENCTFKPKINSSYSMREAPGVSLADRNQHWTERKKEKIESIAKNVEKEEMKDCTFKPKTIKKF
jgi:hypothetical protein